MKILKAHFFLILFISLALTCGAIIIYDIFSAPSLQQSIQTNQTSAQNAVRESANAEKQADNSAITRGIEDGVREQVIQPKLQTARGKSAQSAQKLKEINQRINESKKDISDINASIADNCAKLHGLFPDKNFEYCHDGSDNRVSAQR